MTIKQENLKPLDYTLTQEQEMLVDSVRAFVQQELEPHEAEADRTGEVPVELGQHIKAKAIEMGFYAPNLPESIGGGGLDYKCLALMERELGKKQLWITWVFYIARLKFSWHVREKQINQYLRPCVTGEKKEVFALTEPGAGSDILSMQTKAVRDGDEFVINGKKHFISSPVIPDFAILFAQSGVTETPRGERKLVTGFFSRRRYTRVCH